MNRDAPTEESRPEEAEVHAETEWYPGVARDGGHLAAYNSVTSTSVTSAPPQSLPRRPQRRP